MPISTRVSVPNVRSRTSLSTSTTNTTRTTTTTNTTRTTSNTTTTKTTTSAFDSRKANRSQNVENKKDLTCEFLFLLLNGVLKLNKKYQ
jgi:hypothetical protein